MPYRKIQHDLSVATVTSLYRIHLKHSDYALEHKLGSVPKYKALLWLEPVNSSNWTESVGHLKKEKHVPFDLMLLFHQKPHSDAGHTASLPLLTPTPCVKHIWRYYDCLTVRHIQRQNSISETINLHASGSIWGEEKCLLWANNVITLLNLLFLWLS